MFRYALYARKSDERKEVTEKSIGEQTAECRDLADRHDLQVTREFAESSSALKPGRRPLFNELLRLVERGEIDAILCWHVNRLARNMEESGKLAQLLVDGRIKEIRTPHGVYRSGDNIVPLAVDAATSAQFSHDLIDSVTRGLRGHFESGGVNGKAPVGYLNSRHPVNHKVGIIVPDREGGDRFALLRRAWEMLLTGAYTPAQVGDRLNGEWGFRTRITVKTGGGSLSRSRTYRMFRDPFYAGFVQYMGELRQGTHEPMVTPDEFAQVQSILDAHASGATPRQRRSKRRPESSRSALQVSPELSRYRRRESAYTGLMRCGYCGLQITAEHHTLKNGTPYVFYRCSNSRGTCTEKGVSERRIEEEMARLLTSVRVDPHLFEMAAAEVLAGLDSQVAADRAASEQRRVALAAAERQLTDLDRMWLRGMITDRGRFDTLQAELLVEKNAMVLAEGQGTITAPEDMPQTVSRAKASLEACRHFLLVGPERLGSANAPARREMAHALCASYVLFGGERRLEAEVRPILSEMVRFARSLDRPATGTPTDGGSGGTNSPQRGARRHAVSQNGIERSGSRMLPSSVSGRFKYSVVKASHDEPAFEPGRSGSGSAFHRTDRTPILAGRRSDTLIEPIRLDVQQIVELLAEEIFPFMATPLPDL